MAKTLDEMIDMMAANGQLTEEEKAQVAILRKQIEDARPLHERFKKDWRSLSTEERARLSAASNAGLRIKEIETKAFNRLFGIQS